MKIEFTGRGFEVTDALKNFATEKLNKLSRFIDNIIEAQVTMTVEKHRQTAEIIVKAGHEKLVAKETTNDMYASIGGALDKIEKQAKKIKDRLVSKKRKSSSKESSPAGGKSSELGDIVISHRSLGSVKPMTKEEAILEMENEGSDFIVFRDAENKETISVLYKKDDKNFHLITLE